MTATAASLEAGLDDVSAFIATARAKLIEGELIDLDGVDGKVIGICAEIADLPVTERVAFEHRLAVLLRDLKQISEFLIEQSAAIGEMIDSGVTTATSESPLSEDDPAAA